MKLCIDLCCGLKGFSQAFVHSPDWEVITIDIEPSFEPTICADVRTLTIEAILGQTPLPIEKLVILASPPCERFSLGNRTWPKTGIRLAFEIVGQCCEIIVQAREIFGKENLFYAIENPKGRLRWFLGKPAMTLNLSDYGHHNKKPTDFWTNLPELPLVDSVKPFGIWEQSGPKGNSKTRAADRAELPFGLSKAIFDSVST